MPKSWDNSSALGRDLHLELVGARGLRTSLIDALRGAIRDGRLSPGTTLPPIRALAQDLGLSRNTVGDAYQELVAEGWLVARQGSGTRVADVRRPTAAPPVRKRPADTAPRHNLFPGTPDASSFPRRAWLASTRRALTAAPADAFAPTDPRGRSELRQSLAAYLARVRGVRCHADQIVITSGTAPSLQLLAPLLGGQIAVEGYGLYIHPQILEASGLSTVPLLVDDHGADPAGLTNTRSTATLLTPAHQFPMGGPLHSERRARVIDWARGSGGLVVEDDYDGEFRYDRQPIGALQGLDPTKVIYLGSTSKSLSPALRIGWMVLPEQLVDPLLAIKGEHERWVGVVEQLTLADFIDSGWYDRHIRQMRLRYRHRRDQLVASLAHRAPHVHVTGIAAGLHAVLRLPDGTERETLQRATAAGVAFSGLAIFRHPASTMAAPDGLVVSYGTPADHAFPAALEALCTVLPPPPRHRRHQLGAVSSCDNKKS